MTSVKVALSVIGIICGISSTISGTLVANVPTISNDTPVSITVGLIFAGVFGTAAAAWKVSRAWSQMEAKVEKLHEEVESLKRSRAAALRERLERESREG